MTPKHTDTAAARRPGAKPREKPQQIADELRKMLVDPRRARGMRLFMDLGLAEPILPELVPMRGLPQGPPPCDVSALPPPGQPGELPGGDLWEHVLRVLEKHNNNKPAAAAELGISLKTLYNKVNKLQEERKTAG